MVDKWESWAHNPKPCTMKEVDMPEPTGLVEFTLRLTKPATLDEAYATMMALSDECAAWYGGQGFNIITMRHVQVPVNDS